MKRLLTLLPALLLLAACSAPPEGARLEPQKWGNVIIEVESRPAPPRAGMNEFLVLATEERGRPVGNLMVSLRADEKQPWRQAIQDGLSGVYRRAIKVPVGGEGLHVQIRRKRSDEQIELFFPFPPAR